jgi:hypothetical protein
MYAMQETKRKTSVKTRTQNPTFNEVFEYKGVSRQDVLAKTLQVSTSISVIIYSTASSLMMMMIMMMMMMMMMMI